MAWISLALVVALVVAGGLLLWLAVRAGHQASAARPYGRTATRPTGRGLDPLLLHIDRQIETLLTERHRLQRLILKGERLRGMMLQSAQLRTRVPSVERTIGHLGRRASALDELIGRYHQHRDDLAILRAADEFASELEAYEDHASNARVLDPYADQIAELDGETERLLEIADAEAELDDLLRAS
ncbi:MAG: hypothetical protein IT204_07935 [Fimbriimonadaceae bacterium]|nr:hypothetical protein [Fimbriimonadaceae bacterium]